MLNGNGGSELVPQPQLGMPIQGVQDEGQVGVRVEEPFEAVIPGAVEFHGPRIFVNTPSTNGDWRYMCKAWMRRNGSKLWQWRDFSTILVSGPKLKSSNCTGGWKNHRQLLLTL